MNGEWLLEWVQRHESVLWWLTATSVLVFAASLIVVPLWMVNLPADYFVLKSRRRKSRTDRHPIIRGMWVLTKNLLGCIFIIAGVLMLVLPGQGLLTILAGVMFLNFPGKYKIERWIVSRRGVRQSINWVRRRAGREPLVL